jgi:hypothetical protein
MNFKLVLERIAVHLETEGHPYALLDGLGLAAFGIARATLDLDLLLPSDAQDKLIEFMEDQGFATLHRSSGYSNHLHADEALGRVDFVYVRGDTRDKVFSQAREAEGPGGIPVLVPRPEHMVAMKVLAMKNDPERRHREMADIADLLRLPDVERGEVRGYFTKHQMLALWHELEREDESP